MLPIALPPLTLAGGNGGPSGATASNGISLLSSFGFNFDNSGFVVNHGSPGADIVATGNRDANKSSQTPSNYGGGGGAFGGLPSFRLSPPVFLIGAAVLLLVLHK